MGLYIATLVFFTVNFIFASSKQKEVTAPIEDRINLLKFNINEEIKKKYKGPPIVKPLPTHKLKDENYDYVEMSEDAVTPIMDFDDRKRDDKYKLRQLKTSTTTTPAVPNQRIHAKGKQLKPIPNPSISPSLREDLADLRPDPLQSYSVKPADVFYRRLVDVEARHTPVQWVHCHEMITPFFYGLKSELKTPQRLTTAHRTVVRFVQLLSLNTSTYNKEDIYSLMYQISNVNIRLFQWDVGAIKMLFNVITKGQKHSIKGLKYGIRAIFQKWSLNFSNVTNLLQQAKIFRPPCVTDIDRDGSTKSSKTTRYTRSTAPTTKCAKKIEDDYYETT